MCTAVVGGSIHLAATRISTAKNQRNANPMTTRRITDLRETFQSRGFEFVRRFATTFQNNLQDWIYLVTGKSGWGPLLMDSKPVSRAFTDHDPDRAGFVHACAFHSYLFAGSPDSRRSKDDPCK